MLHHYFQQPFDNYLNNSLSAYFKNDFTGIIGNYLDTYFGNIDTMFNKTLLKLTGLLNHFTSIATPNYTATSSNATSASINSQIEALKNEEKQLNSNLSATETEIAGRKFFLL